MSDQQATAEIHLIEVGGLTVGYRQVGSGPTLVLLHGAFEDGRVWTRQLAELSDEFTVIALDAPGFGASDDPPPTWTTADYGNYSTCSASTDRPWWASPSARSTRSPCTASGRRRSAPWFSSPHTPGGPGPCRRKRPSARIRQTERDMSAPVEQTIEKWLPTLLTPAASPDVVELVATMMRDFRPTGVRPAVTALGAADLRDVLTTIAVPTLLIYGDADVRSPADIVGRDMHTRIPGSTLVVIPDAPHMVNLEQPKALNTAIRRFACED